MDSKHRKQLVDDLTEYLCVQMFGLAWRTSPFSANQEVHARRAAENFVAGQCAGLGFAVLEEEPAVTLEDEAKPPAETPAPEEAETEGKPPVMEEKPKKEAKGKK